MNGAVAAGASISTRHAAIETNKLVESMTVPIEPASATATILQAVRNRVPIRELNISCSSLEGIHSKDEWRIGFPTAPTIFFSAARA